MIVLLSDLLLLDYHHVAPQGRNIPMLPEPRTLTVPPELRVAKVKGT